MSKLSELLAKAKARAEAQKAAFNVQGTTTGRVVYGVPAVTEIAREVKAAVNPDTHIGTDRYGNTIEWNKEQWEFIQFAVGGKSCILIGAAGTGKTTTMKGTIEQLLITKHYGKLDDEHKYLPSSTPGIVAVSYTRRAVMNLKRAMPEDLKSNCITIHKLLEYAPVFYEVVDADGKTAKKMQFEATRNQFRHLSPNIKTVIIDESSMVSVSLFYQIYLALPDPSSVQFIFLGDIQQLPPVFGSAILGYKMLSLPTVELTQVYRQALESPIIRLAHRILSGKPIHSTEFPDWNVPGKLTIHPWKKQISADNALLTIAGFFKRAFDAGAYDPLEEMILIPFNKSCGTDELNKHIANHIARSRKLDTYEVIAGFNRHYYTVGDKVLYEKEDAVIVDIKPNPTYTGKYPQSASPNLDYWGTVQTDPDAEVEHHISDEDVEMDEDIDSLLLRMGSVDDEERVREASHIITVKLLDSEREIDIKTAGTINNMILAYALTVHKSQGSEWRKVFVVFHQSHATMIQRELLYTAVTRAREELYIICEPDSIAKGITRQRIKGNTLKAKAEFFKGKLERNEEALVDFLKDKTTTGEAS